MPRASLTPAPLSVLRRPAQAVLLLALGVCVLSRSGAQPLPGDPGQAGAGGDRDQAFALGVEAAAAGNFAEAYCHWRPLADYGDRQAQYRLGWMYANGEGLRQDYRVAADWWEKAARQGHLDANLAVARAYRTGRGRDKDADQAVYWLLVAARGGSAEAGEVLRGMAASGNPTALAEVQRRLLGGGWEVLGGQARVARQKTNLRENVSTSSRILATLKKNDQLVVLAEQGQWLRVGVVGSGRLGWVYRPLVAYAEP